MTAVSNEHSWRDAVIGLEATLKEAVQALDRSALKIVLVVDSDQRLAGTITDGDIRRGILRGEGLECSIGSVVHRDPIVVPPGIDTALAAHMMRVNKLLHLPVVDTDRRLVGLHMWETISQPEPRTNRMVVMAGGLGTRLRPHTEHCPKPMVPVGGKPILEHVIEHARSQGITRFTFAVRYLGEVIADYFGDGATWNVDIDYIWEDEPLGTAGALSLLEELPDLPIVVTNGDVLTTVRYGEMLDFHSEHEATATMAVRQHEWQHPFGVVSMDGIGVVGFDEKPVHRTNVNAGVYVLTRSALKQLETKQRCDMPNFLMSLVDEGDTVIAYPVHENWIDVGRPDDLHAAEFAATDQ